MRLRVGPLLLVSLALVAACSDVRDHIPITPPSRASRSVAANANPRYIVVLRNDVTGVPAVAAGMASAHNASADFVYTAALKGFAAHLSPDAVDALERDPRVMMVVREKAISLRDIETPAPSWGLDRIDQRDLPLDTRYTFLRTGLGVHYYGIDTGILPTHTEFVGRIQPGFTAINDGNGTADCNGHGTHTASTAAGNSFGVAKRMTIVPVRVLDCTGNATTTELIAGIDWITANRILPAVANVSLNALGTDAPTDSAISRSIAAGVVYVVAAGNANADACQVSPSDLPAAITVGATETADLRASFSNFGVCLDLFAPGQGITGAWIGSNTATNTIDGTSVAAPHVAGVAGLYLEANPGASPAAVANALAANATPNKISNPGLGSPNLILYSGFIAANIPPVADFTWTCAPKQSCTLDASSSRDSDGTIASYTWTIGKSKKTLSGAVLVTDLKGNRDRQITLTVTDNNGATASVTKTVSP